jgi:hypothetical protein
VLNHPRPRPSDLALPPAQSSVLPRAVYAFPGVSVEVWCLGDLLEDLPDRTRYQSSTERKAERLPRIFNGRYPDLVVSVGTAGFPSDLPPENTENGTVVVGRRVFIYNHHPNGTNPFSNWSHGPFNKVIDSAVDPTKFAEYVTFAKPGDVTTRFVRVPKNPAQAAAVLADPEGVSLGSVNVTDYGEYDASDQAARDTFNALGTGANAVSLETTHGLICSMYHQAAPDPQPSAVPFLFVSGITDRFLQFKTEVQPFDYAQNFAASHNMGVVVAWMIPNIADHLVAFT